MPLKIRVKPDEKVTIGENTIQNVGGRPIDLLVSGPDRVRREGYHEKLVGDRHGR